MSQPRSHRTNSTQYHHSPTLTTRWKEAAFNARASTKRSRRKRWGVYWPRKHRASTWRHNKEGCLSANQQECRRMNRQACLSFISLFALVDMIHSSLGYPLLSRVTRYRTWQRAQHYADVIRRYSRPSPSSDGLDDDDEINLQHLKFYRITGIGQGSAVDIGTNTGHSLQTDVPRKMGGRDAAPQPVETLLTALAGCTQATAVFVGRQMKPRVVLRKLEFDLSAHRDERGALQLPIEELPSIPSRLTQVSGTIRVFAKGGEPLTQHQLDVLSEQTEARCPVANMMIASGCKMDVQWVDGGSEQTILEDA